MRVNKIIVIGLDGGGSGLVKKRLFGLSWARFDFIGGIERHNSFLRSAMQCLNNYMNRHVSVH